MKNHTTDEEFLSMVRALEGLVQKGDGKAAFELACRLNPESMEPPPVDIVPITKETTEGLYTQAYALLLNEAEQGDGESMHLIAIYHQAGFPPVKPDMRKFLDWNEKAVNAGYLFAANDLYALYSDPNSDYYDPQRAKYVSDIKDSCKF